MAKYEGHFSGEFSTFLASLEHAILNSGMSVQLVDSSDFSSGDYHMAVRVYDKYFMRVGNRVSLTLTIVSAGTELFVSAIGAGGGNGAFLSFSYGAETKLVQVVQDALQNMCH